MEVTTGNYEVDEKYNRGNKIMKRRIYRGLAVLGIIGLCVGLFGCGNDTESTVPLEVGEHITYGKYQGEDIVWRVVDKKDGEVLLLSEYGLDAQPFDTSGKIRVSWKDSTIRKWLNDDFYNSAFSEEERENIILSSSKGFKKNNEAYYGFLTMFYWHLERNTEDKIFLLSYTEMTQYFCPRLEKGYYYDWQYGYDELLCYPTEYTKQQLVRALNPETSGWWLCNPQYDPDVDEKMTRKIEVISAWGQPDVEIDKNSKSYAVRPAMWVTWQSDMEVIEE